MNCTEAGKLGGLARKEKLSPKRRKEISIAANKAKALKHKPLKKLLLTKIR